VSCQFGVKFYKPHAFGPPPTIRSYSYEIEAFRFNGQCLGFVRCSRLPWLRPVAGARRRELGGGAKKARRRRASANRTPLRPDRQPMYMYRRRPEKPGGRRRRRPCLRLTPPVELKYGARGDIDHRARANTACRVCRCSITRMDACASYILLLSNETSTTKRHTKNMSAMKQPVNQNEHEASPHSSDVLSTSPSNSPTSIQGVLPMCR
jgi:hypothetical protein